MADASGSIRNIQEELGKATEKAVALNIQLRELNAPGSNATAKEIAELNDELNKTIEKSGELQASVDDVNQRIAVLASKSKFTQLSNNIGDVGSKIASLDFTGANESATRLLQLSKSITFKSAISEVKNLGSTFLKLGKSLLTNPLFLIAGVVIGLVVAIGKALNELGLLKKYTELVGKAMKYLSDLITDAIGVITDFFGLTSKAGREATKELVKNAEKAEKSAVAYEKKSEGVIQALDNEIRMAKLQGKNTDELETKKVRLITQTALVRYNADVAAYNAAVKQNKLSKEEIADLKEKLRLSKNVYNQALADEIYFKEELKKIKSDADKQDATDGAKKREEDAKKRLEYLKERLEVERDIKDMELEAMEDGREKEIAITTEKYKRLREDNNKNSKLTSGEKVKLDQLLVNAERDNLKKINKKYDDIEIQNKKEQDKKLYDAQQEYYNKFDLLGLTEFEKQYRIRQNQYDDDVAALDKALEEKIISQEEYNDKLRLLTTEVNEDLSKIDEEKRKDDEAKRKEEIEGIQSDLNKLGDIFTELGSKLGSSILTSVGDVFNGISSMIEISQKEFEKESERYLEYARVASDLVSGVLSSIIQDNEKALNEDLVNIEDKYKAQNDIIQTQLDNGVITQQQADIKLKELNIAANKEKDDISRKSFEQNKKLKIAQAAMDGFSGAVAAFAGAMSLGPIAGPIVGAILAASVATVTALNINKIKQTSYTSTASSGGSGSISPSSGSSSISRTAPEFNLFGKGNDKNNIVAGSEKNTMDKNINVTSTVSVSEINEVQNKVEVQEDKSTL